MLNLKRYYGRRGRQEIWRPISGHFFGLLFGFKLLIKWWIFFNNRFSFLRWRISCVNLLTPRTWKTKSSMFLALERVASQVDRYCFWALVTIMGQKSHRLKWYTFVWQHSLLFYKALETNFNGCTNRIAWFRFNLDLDSLCKSRPTKGPRMRH